MWILYAFDAHEVKISCCKIWPTKTLHTNLILRNTFQCKFNDNTKISFNVHVFESFGCKMLAILFRHQFNYLLMLWNDPFFYKTLNCPDSKVHGANMGPIWGRQDPGGPHVGPVNFAIWVCTSSRVLSSHILIPTSLILPMCLLLQVPFGTMVALLCMWFGISLPLVFLGYYFGYRKLVSNQAMFEVVT